MKARKNIVVTGGAGFIGASLCRHLLNHGSRIICVDNLYTGSRENIRDLESCPDFIFLEKDVTEPFEADADEIYHLACPASPKAYQSDPLGTARTCVLGSLHMLELAGKTGARILLASTSEVYGDPEVHPQKEDYRGNVNPIGPRSCYDEGKRMAETLFFDSRRQYGTDIRVVRIFNTYGPYMTTGDGRVISNFNMQALTGQDITIYGDGSQTRSFCYADDTVDALIRMMEQEAFPGPVNIGNPCETTILEIAEKIRELTGSRSRLRTCRLPEDDPARRKPDITLAKTGLGWEPRVPLVEGLKKTIAWFQTGIAGS